MWCIGLIERPCYRLLAHEGWHSKEGGGCRCDAVSWDARCGVLGWLRSQVIGCLHTKLAVHKKAGVCQCDSVCWGRSVSWSAQCGSLSWTARCGVLSWLGGHVIGCLHTKEAV